MIGIPTDAPQWAQDFVGDVNRAIMRLQRPAGNPVFLGSFVVADLPTASDYQDAQIIVSNETGGAVPAFSDGTNWRRVTDRAIVA